MSAILFSLQRVSHPKTDLAKESHIGALHRPEFGGHIRGRRDDELTTVMIDKFHTDDGAVMCPPGA